MTTKQFVYALVLVGLIFLGVYYSRVFMRPVQNEVPSVSASSTKMYVNNQYGFSVSYPKEVLLKETFTPFYLLSDSWRLFAPATSTGTPLVSFVVYTIDQEGGVATGKAYPLFYQAVLRVGVSKDVARCFDRDAGYSDQVVTDVTINGFTFKRFSFSDAGMMKYVHGESYRTIHKNMCYVLEQIGTGSSYKDETMQPGIGEAELTSYYNSLRGILETFTFLP